MVVYETLQTPREFRVLKLHPGSPGDPVTVSLETCQLDDKPLYEAISYVWGDPADTRTISCNNTDVNITTNLYSALICFRLSDRARIVWADAICIDQADLDERSSQVQVMHLIYKNCERCLVWLGPEDKHVGPAHEIIDSITSAVCNRTSVHRDDLDKHLRTNGRDMFLAQEIAFNGVTAPESPAWGSLMHFFSRPWFTRVWVIQEVFFAREVKFFCNGDVFSFSSIFYTVDWILTNGQHINWAANPELAKLYVNSSYNNILAMQSDDQIHNERSLEQLLDFCRKFNATDPRDKAYALMNLPSFRREYPDIIPNYRLSIVEIFTDLAMTIMKNRKSLSVLTQVEHDPQEPDEGFPSWVPRWHRRKRELSVSSIWYEYFSAGSAPTAPHLNIPKQPGPDLILNGLVFDTVQDTCGIEIGNGQGTSPAKPVFSSIQSWKSYALLKGNGPYDSEASIVQAFAMTFTAMCREYRGVFALKCSPENYGHHIADFVAWLQWLRGDGGIKAGNYPPGLYSEEKPFLPDTDDETVRTFALRYHNMVKFYTLGKKLFRTSKGYLGLGSQGLQAGDSICIAFGGALPLILRRRKEGGYILVGDAYIHGIMDGEVVVSSDIGPCEARETFHIY